MQVRTSIAAAIAALALAGATGCGEDEAATPSTEPDAPVNTDTPSADPESTTPAPDEQGESGGRGGGY